MTQSTAELLKNSPGESLVEAVDTQAETNAHVARATGVLALGTIASRLLGLAREIVMTNLFGASHAVDAFEVATAIPTSFYDLLIGGHVNSAIIPILSEVVTREGRQALWDLVSALVNLVTVILAALVVLVELFAPQVIGVVGSGFDPRTAQLATDLLRLVFPSLLFMGLFAVLSGTLYALRVFTWPAFATAVFNGCIVLVTVLFAPPFQVTLDGRALHLLLNRPPEGVTIVAVGWLVGALAQLALQLPGMRGFRLRLTLNWRHPGVRRIAALYAPVMFSLVLDTLVIRPFSYNLASLTGAGSIGYMNWATTLVQFPQGMVATAISVAILPTLARQAALITRQGDKAFKDTLGLGLRLATTLIIPATMGLFVLATPIISLLFQHGAFGPVDTRVTALALRLYLVGLPFAALDLLLVYAFYARQDTLTPALVGILSLLVYIVVAVGLLPRYGLFSLMIADSMKHVVHASVSGYLLMRRMKGFGGQRLLLTFGKTGLAALGMGVAERLALPFFFRYVGVDSVLHELVLVTALGSVSLAVFAALAAILKIEELRWIGGMIARRLRRSR
jgi:putative peptidoglycan lipid II flippase